MVTDDERRRVAKKLREYASWDEEGYLTDCAEWGESVLNLLNCGDTDRETYAALADLIEPDANAQKCSEAAQKTHRLSVHVDGRRVLELDALRIEVKPDFEVKPHLSPYADLSDFEEVSPKYVVTAELPSEIRFREHA